jgi:uncharacterized protein
MSTQRANSIVATSVGGVATILVGPNMDVEAVVLEQLYPTTQQALEDRLAIYLGTVGRWLAPVMLMTLRAHISVYPDQLRPIDHMVI